MEDLKELIANDPKLAYPICLFLEALNKNQDIDQEAYEKIYAFWGDICTDVFTAFMTQIDVELFLHEIDKSR